MKVKILRRNLADYVRETKRDIHKLPRNFAPDHHPFEEAREYQRAVNAAKLDRLFAKPFLCALSGHSEGVSAVALHPKRLSLAASTSFDGEVRMWDLAARKCVVQCQGHARGSYARDLVFDPTGERLFSVGDDKQVRIWGVGDDEGESSSSGGATRMPLETILSKGILTGITHHRYEKTFATCGDAVTLWDAEVRSAVTEYSWGVDSVHHVRFNQVEHELLGACASDRSVLLYDTRESRPMRKVVLDLRSNAIAWNPMEAFVFAVANEDYNSYVFDLRQLRRPLNVHMDHTSAVTCLDYAPTGRELVTGSYDKTLRIFRSEEGHSREVYHTKRMQRLTCVAWTKDNRYVLSGSDEMNLRLWKARASEKLGILRGREKAALEYADKLKEKYGSHPQVRKIVRHRQVPKHVLNAQKEHKVIKESKKRKEANRRKHSKPGTVPFVPEREKHVVREDT